MNLLKYLLAHARVAPVFVDACNAREVSEALEVDKDEDEDLYRNAGQRGYGGGSAQAMEREVGEDEFLVLPSSVWAGASINKLENG
jgi:hypothetical protein